MIKKTYSFTFDGKNNDVYTLSNGFMEVDVLTFGARIISIRMPDKDGNMGDLVMGCKTPEDYYALPLDEYFGATVGRFCNRIEKGKFTLNGKEYTLEINNGENSLHGGVTARFDRLIWNAKIDGDGIIFSHFSPDGAGGYPGNLEISVRYALTNGNEIVIDYFARSDKDTILSVTNHTFFNIGNDATVLDQELMIKASKTTPVGFDLIPHGDYLDIDGTPFSFNPAKTIRKDTFSDNELIKHCKGFDFNYCIDRSTEKDLEFCACLIDRNAGRKMDCYTTMPGIQLYSGCHLNYKGKKDYGRYAGLCLETQFYPNSPNCPEYPSCTLKAGEDYRHTTVYAFSLVK
jgi:aldose 1-epimerase